jgi:hypothetical protein
MYQQDARLLEGAFQAQVEKLKNDYFFLLQRAIPPSIQSIPVFQESFWDVIIVYEADAEYLDLNLNDVDDISDAAVIRYILDDSYADIPHLFNTIFNPTVIYTQGDAGFVRNPETTLVIDEVYYNGYDDNITVGLETVPPGGTFVATDTFYTATGSATGAVYRNYDFFITRGPIEILLPIPD